MCGLKDPIYVRPSRVAGSEVWMEPFPRDLRLAFQDSSVIMGSDDQALFVGSIASVLDAARRGWTSAGVLFSRSATLVHGRFGTCESY